MLSDPAALGFEVALLSLAAHFDLNSKADRKASAAWLFELFFRLTTRAVRPPLVLELGAFSARFSRVSRKDLPQTRFHAFEANPYNFEAFRADVEGDGVSYHHLAIGAEVKDAVLKIARRNGCDPVDPVRANNSLRVKAKDIEYEDAPVRMVTVDHFVRDQGLQDLACALWIDLEGCCHEALEGARETLERASMVFVELEDEPMWVGQKTAPDVMRLLMQAGFAPVARDFEFPSQYNVIFMRPETFRSAPVQIELSRAISGLGQRPRAETARP